MNEALPLEDTTHATIHNADVPGDSMFAEPVCLTLSVSLWQEFHGPVIDNDNVEQLLQVILAFLASTLKALSSLVTQKFPFSKGITL